ncbi:MAG: hypothetical protein ABGW69_04010 [Nanoarchaeota archaeon]
MKLNDLFINSSSNDKELINKLLKKLSLKEKDDLIRDLKFIVKATNEDLKKYGKTLFSLFLNIFYTLYYKKLNENLKIKVNNRFHKVIIESKEVFPRIFNIMLKIKEQIG